MPQQAAKIAITTGATATVDSVINGTDLGKNLVEDLKTSLINAIGADAAGAIGAAGQNAIASAVAHAAVGCAEGAANGGGCSAGAIGAAAGELAARWNVESDSNKLFQNALGDGNLSEKDKVDIITGLTISEQTSVNIAKLAGALAAATSGEDADGINAASNAAGIAAENNSVHVIEEARAMIAAGRTLVAGAEVVTAAAGELAAGATACVASVGCGLIVLGTVVVVVGGIAVTKYVLGYNSDAGLNLPVDANGKPTGVVDDSKSSGGTTAGAGTPMPDPDDEDDWDTNLDNNKGNGHTLDRHVGQSDEEIMQRFQDFEQKYSGTGNNSYGVSTFTDQQTAQQVVDDAIGANRAEISEWLNSSRNGDFAFNYETNQVIGRGISPFSSDIFFGLSEGLADLHNMSVNGIWGHLLLGVTYAPKNYPHWGHIVWDDIKLYKTNLSENVVIMQGFLDYIGQ